MSDAGRRGTGSSVAADPGGGLFGTQRTTMYSTAQGSIHGGTMRSSMPSLPTVDLRSSTEMRSSMDLRASMPTMDLRASMDAPDMRTSMDAVRRRLSLARSRARSLSDNAIAPLLTCFHACPPQSTFLSRSIGSRPITPRSAAPHEPPAPIFDPDMSEAMKHHLQKHVETRSIAGYGSQKLQVLTVFHQQQGRLVLHSSDWQ
jgi:hypothetical protein